MKHILELEGVKFEKYSPLEFRKLQNQLEEVTKERDELLKIISEINVAVTKGNYKLINKNTV